MSTKQLSLALVAALATIAGAAAELQAIGAIRPEHDTRWQGLRTAIDQASDQARELEAAATADVLPPPDAAALRALQEAVSTVAGAVAEVSERLELVATVTDHTGDLVQGLTALANTAKG